MMGIDGNQLRKSQEDLMIGHLFNSTAARGEISLKEGGGNWPRQRLDGLRTTLLDLFTFMCDDVSVVGWQDVKAEQRTLT